VFRSSLRFKLSAVFLLGIVCSGLVASLIALRHFQVYTRDQSVRELRKEAHGLAQLYAQSARRATDEGRRAPDFAAAKLEDATGDRLFYVGPSVFPGEDSGLKSLSEAAIGRRVPTTRTVVFEFTPPGESRTFLAVSNPLELEPGTPAVGALVVAKPKTERRDRWLTLFRRLAAAFLGGLIVSGVLAAYLTRRITDPVLQLSRAADDIAEGRYDAPLPALSGSDEIAHLSNRFREMAARLAEAQELERNFLMSVSHELRTPLTGIRGHVAALREGVVTDPELAEESLAVVAAETDRLERLVGDVLDLAKLDAHRFTVLSEEVDMGRLVDRAYASFTEEARRRSIEYRLVDSARPTIVTDGDRVLQIISNLLSNAFRWTPDGGEIDVALGAENGIVQVDVADSGPGIAPEQRERIFRPFFSHDAQGTGLGLPIARELAVALGGRSEVDSRPGAGSRFRLVLPAGVV
jgi:two-component system sensor histidine kinase BaeS